MTAPLPGTQSRRLDGKVAVITGASRGIGAAIARAFAAEGAKVVLAARTLDESTPSPYPGTLVETLASIRDAGGEASGIRCDLTVAEDRARLVDEARRIHGPVDILVNNAAASWAKPFEDYTAKQYDVMFAVHVRAAFELVQLVLPDMDAAGRGWVLNMTSAAARHPEGPPYEPSEQAQSTLVYAMCKQALERMTTGLAAYLWERNVAVNALGPSKAVLTYGMNHPPVDESNTAAIEPAEDTAAAALVLCSGDPRTLTGRVTATDDVLRGESTSRPMSG